MGEYVSPKPLFSIDGTFPDVQAAHTICIDATPHHQRCRLLICLLISWVVPLLFTLQETASMVFKKHSNIDSSDHRTVFHFASGHFRWALAESSISGSRSHMASSLTDTALTCIYGLHGELCSQTVISGNVPEPMQGCPVENHAHF